MKFCNLLKKELKELLSVQTIITIFASLFIFIFLGQVIGDTITDMEKESSTITICDQDNSELTKAMLASLSQTDEIKLDKVILQSDNYSEELKRLDKDSMLILPKGFSDSILVDNKKAKIIQVGKIKSSSAFNNMSSLLSQSLTDAISKGIQTSVIATSNLNDDLKKLASDPLDVQSISIVKDKSAEIDPSSLLSFLNTQSFIIPIIVFLMVVYCSQMIMNSIATEKIDKTLETLLSTPVSRLSILISKIVAAAIVAGLSAGTYMIGFSQFMRSITSKSDGSGSNVTGAIVELGLKLEGADYLLLAIQLFLTIMITLCISLILGALAKDIKSSQTLILPITFSAMIPYFLCIFTNVQTLPIVARVLLYLIPFTHTFTASDNILFGNTALFWSGVAYQVVFLIVCIALALKVFMTDKILTMTISFGQKKKTRKKGLLTK